MIQKNEKQAIEAGDRMIKVRVATSNTRGFLVNLFEHSFSRVIFLYEKKDLYEVFGKTRGLLANVIKWRIFDYLGIFQVIKPVDSEENAYFSYNRFLDTDKPYLVLLENPSALVNYCWNRPKYCIARNKLKRLFNNEKLRIVCMSQACYSSITKLYQIPASTRIEQLYPLIPDDDCYGEQDNHSNCFAKIIECIYISSDFNMKGGNDLIEVFEKLHSKGAGVHLTCITRKESIKPEQLKLIEKLDNIELIEFSLSKEELNSYYKKSSILLNPTRADSFSLVTLEAIKYGCAVIATDVYAIREMVINDYNGYTKPPIHNQWDENGFPNPYYVKHQRTICGGELIDQELVDWMYEKIVYLEKNRNLLKQLCDNSIELARSDLFSEESIARKWGKLICEVVGVEL